MSTDYEPNFDIDFRYGQEGEGQVHDMISGLINGRTEVKRDAEWVRTGNIYVEQECRRQGVFRPSGLSTTTAEWWVFVLGATGLMLVIETERLRDLARRYGRPRECVRGSHPTKGVVLRVGPMLTSVQAASK